MFYNVQRLINEIVPDEPDPAAANALQEGLGGQFGVLDLLYNLMLESTGRLQKCRLYEMTANKTARTTIAYLIVRDQAHKNASAKALETLGSTGVPPCPSPRPTPRSSPRSRSCSTSACTPSNPTSGWTGSRSRPRSSRGRRR